MGMLTSNVHLYLSVAFLFSSRNRKLSYIGFQRFTDILFCIFEKLTSVYNLHIFSCNDT